MKITHCRSCRSDALVSVLDLGEQRLSTFPAPEVRGDFYGAWPLHLVQCTACTLLQLEETTPRDLLYTDDYGFRSGVAETIRADLASVVRTALQWRPNPSSWLDIGSNDGTLLGIADKITAEWGTYLVGQEPVDSIRTEAISRYPAVSFTDGFFSADAHTNGRYDVITAVSMFYDVEDPVGFCRDMEAVLAPGGVIVVQQNYALNMLRFGAIDNISHEHITYYTLRALRETLARAGLKILEVGYSMVNGGCIRTVIGRIGDWPAGHTPQTLRAFDSEAESLPRLVADAPRVAAKLKSDIIMELGRIRSLGHSIGVLGASTRGGTLLQWLTDNPSSWFTAAYERQPQKVGKVWGATGLPIRDEVELFDQPIGGPMDLPKYLFVSPWFFRDQIIDRYSEFLAAGGRLIFPLPTLEVIGQ